MPMAAVRLSAAASAAFTVDVDPTAPVITAVVGQPVNGGTVELRGTGEVGETVTLYADGGSKVVGSGIGGLHGRCRSDGTRDHGSGRSAGERPNGRAAGHRRGRRDRHPLC